MGAGPSLGGRTGAEALSVIDLGQATPLSKSLNLLLHQMGTFQPQSCTEAVPRGLVQPWQGWGREQWTRPPQAHQARRPHPCWLAVLIVAPRGAEKRPQVLPVQPGLSDLQGCGEGDEDEGTT